MKRKLYRAAIIGAGRIAAQYDSPQDRRVLTHAHAIRLNRSVRGLGFYDKNFESARKAGHKWKLRPFRSLDEMLRDSPEIVVVAVPDESHFDVLKTVLDYSPRVVMCEKPLATSFAKSLEIDRMFRKKGVLLTVNYQRRYDSSVFKLRREIARGRYGRPLSGVVYYSKGILHNGSHAMDLLRFLFGEAESLLVSERLNDYRKDDPTVGGIVFFDGFSVHLVAGNQKYVSLFEIDLIFEKARFRFVDSGFSLEQYGVVKDPVFQGFRRFGNLHRRKTELRKSLSDMWAETIAYLDAGELPRTASTEILGGQYLCEALVKAPLNRLRVLTGYR